LQRRPRARPQRSVGYDAAVAPRAAAPLIWLKAQQNKLLKISLGAAYVAKSLQSRRVLGSDGIGPVDDLSTVRLSDRDHGYIRVEFHNTAGHLFPRRIARRGIVSWSTDRRPPSSAPGAALPRHGGRRSRSPPPRRAAMRQRQVVISRRSTGICPRRDCYPF
jgi:hypothetical protein